MAITTALDRAAIAGCYLPGGEAARNNDNGTVAADIAPLKSVKIRNVTINGTHTESLSAPTVPTITAAANAKSSIRVSWATVPEYTEDIKVYRNGTLVATVSVNTASYYDDTPLTPSTSYAYTAKASNTTGDSSLSASVSASTLAGTADAVTLSTTALSGVINYSGVPIFFASAHGTFCDFRIFSTLLSEDEFGYYYKDIINNNGLIMMPKQ